MALDPKCRIEQFSSVFDLRNSEGKPYLLIGDQAVNFWAERYLRDDPNLERLQPFTSEDIDSKGNRTDVEHIARQLNLRWVFPDPREMTSLAGAIPFRIGGLGSSIEVVRRILCLLRPVLPRRSARRGPSPCIPVPTLAEHRWVLLEDYVDNSGRPNCIRLGSILARCPAVGSDHRKQGPQDCPIPGQRRAAIRPRRSRWRPSGGETEPGAEAAQG